MGIADIVTRGKQRALIVAGRCAAEDHPQPQRQEYPRRRGEEVSEDQYRVSGWTEVYLREI